MAKELRTHRVVVVLTNAEQETLQRIVEAHPTARTVSDYIRQRALGPSAPRVEERIEAAIAAKLVELELPADAPIARHPLSNEYTVSQLLRRWLFVDGMTASRQRSITHQQQGRDVGVIWIDRDNDTSLMIPVYP
jgi:uncharacterized heparinase superfamily protein